MGAREVGEHLRNLLVQPGSARTRWQHRQRSAVGTGEVNHAAIARVLAEHLWEQGLRPDTDTALPRTLKDLVGRALHGERITPQTIGWFCGAFDLGPAEESRLLALLEGSTAVRVVVGSAAPPPQTVQSAPRTYRTISLHEHHYLGPAGQPVKHSTTQVIEATADGVRAHRYVFDTDTLTVDVLQGGHLDTAIHALGNGLFAADIVLTRALVRGETATLRYDSRFATGISLPPEFRRGAFHPVENVDLRVEFHPMRRPARLRYAEWSDLDGAAVLGRELELDADHSAHVYLSRLERVVVGFVWAWD